MDEPRKCVYCGNDLHAERPFEYCLEASCYEKGFKQAEYYVLGVHKSAPVVVWAESSEVKAKISYMNVK